MTRILYTGIFLSVYMPLFTFITAVQINPEWTDKIEGSYSSVYYNSVDMKTENFGNTCTAGNKCVLGYCISLHFNIIHWESGYLYLSIIQVPEREPSEFSYHNL